MSLFNLFKKNRKETQEDISIPDEVVEKLIAENPLLSDPKQSTERKQSPEYTDNFYKKAKLVEIIDIDSMMKYNHLPFDFSEVQEVKKHLYGPSEPVAFVDVSGKNKSIAKQQIFAMQELVDDCAEQAGHPKGYFLLNVEKLVFSPPDPEFPFHGYTKIHCTPLTQTRKDAKFPFSLFFTTRNSWEDRENTFNGELVYNKSGRVEKGRIAIFKDGAPLIMVLKTIDGKLRAVRDTKYSYTW